MPDIAKRFPENPLLKPSDIGASRPDLHVICLLNPGVFRFEGKIWMILRVAENADVKTGVHRYPILDAQSGVRLKEVPVDHPDLNTTDARVHQFQGIDYLTTLSHLRLVCSDDGIRFYEPDGFPPIQGILPLEGFGIEDCRVACIEEIYYLTYTAVSEFGVGVGLRTTRDWKIFEYYGMIISPHNKDCALFEEKINGKFYAFHRPSSVSIGGNYIWLAESLDGIHWGNHTCLLTTRSGMWDSARVGAGAAPIKTDKGWLEIYHGANDAHEYCLGAFLLDLANPSIVMGRTVEPIMIPSAAYEVNGFFNNVVFTNGHIVNTDTITIYYGAADEFICGAKFSVKEILSLMVSV